MGMSAFPSFMTQATPATQPLINAEPAVAAQTEQNPQVGQVMPGVQGADAPVVAQNGPSRDVKLTFAQIAPPPGSMVTSVPGFMVVYTLPMAPIPMYQVPLGLAAETMRSDSEAWADNDAATISVTVSRTFLRIQFIHILLKIRGDTLQHYRPCDGNTAKHKLRG